MFSICSYFFLFRAKDRLTIQEREREEAKARQLEKEAARAAEDRRRQTLRMVEDEVNFMLLLARFNSLTSFNILQKCN